MNSELEEKSKQLFLKFVMDASDTIFPSLIFSIYGNVIKDGKIVPSSKMDILEEKKIIKEALNGFATNVMHSYANYIINNDENIILNISSLCGYRDEEKNYIKSKCIEMLNEANIFESK